MVALLLGVWTAAGAGWSADEQRWLTNALERGQMLDFADPGSPFGAGRVLRAEVLRDLLVNPAHRISDLGIQIAHAEVPDALDLQNATVRLDVKLSNCVFYKTVNLNGVDFKKGLKLDNSEFRAGVTARRALVGGDFTADSAYCFSSFHGQGLKVGGSIWLAGATFLGAVELGYSTVGEELSLARSLFYEADKGVELYRASVAGMLDMSGATFHGPANFILLGVKGNLTASSAAFLHTNDLSVDAGRQSHYNADFGSLRVDGFSFFNDVRFDGEVSFRNAQFARLYLDGVSWPTNLHRMNCVRVEWMRYVSIQATTNFAHAESNRSNMQWKHTQTETWDSLRPVLAAHSPYSADVYSSLEAYFKKEGANGLAREAGYENARQYRKKVLWTEAGLGWEGVKAGIGWLWNWLLQITVGHGHYPIGALAWSVGIILFGCWTFRISNMRPVPGKSADAITGKDVKGWRRLLVWLGSKDRTYHAFWYSLDMFIPIIDLKANDDWMPKPEERFVWHYLIIHRTLGVILVPIGLAAFSGIIK